MNILFTGFYFDGYHGSMLHICEIAKYLSSKGHKCYCASLSITEEIKQYTKSNELDLYHVMELPIDIEYDIVWTYHYPLFPYLLDRGLKYKKVHIGCLSSFVSFEVPAIFYQNTALITSMSEETKEKLVSNYDIEEKDIYVLKNLLPDIFIQSLPPRSGNILPQNIAIISNHPPKELVDLPNFLPDIKIDFYGRNSNNYQPITPEILSKYDIIISIGKTVQYALGMGIPIYNYDHFGGSGYITLANIDKEEYHNYSGRSFHRQISSEEIEKEILDGYSKAVEQAPKLREIAIDRYLLSKNIDKIMNIIDKKSNTKIDDTTPNKIYIQHCKFVVEQCNHYLNIINKNNISINLKDEIINNKDYELRQKTNEIKSLKQQISDLSKKLKKKKRKYKRYKRISILLIVVLVLFFLANIVIR